MFYCCRRHKIALKAFCATLRVVVLLTVTCTSVTHTEAMVRLHCNIGYAIAPPYYHIAYRCNNKHNEDNKTPSPHVKSANYAQCDRDYNDTQTICIRQYHLSAFLPTISLEVCRSVPRCCSFRTRSLGDPFMQPVHCISISKAIAGIFRKFCNILKWTLFGNG
jgi:hypothetical protein